MKPSYSSSGPIDVLLSAHGLRRTSAARLVLGLSLVKEIAESANWRISACEARRTGASIRLALHGSDAVGQDGGPMTSTSSTLLAFNAAEIYG